MADINDRILVDALLKLPLSPQVSLGVGLQLIDNDRVPIESRYITVTPQDYQTELPSGIMQDFANAYFTQEGPTPAELRFGRWVKTASSPMFEGGPQWAQDAATWAFVSDGVFDVTDGTNTDQIGPLNFSGVTAISQILAILDAGLAAVALPNITGLDSSVFEFSPVDGTLRLVMSTTGAAAATVSIVSGTAIGTDIYEILLDASNGISLSGYDVETGPEALQAISELNDGYYFVMVSGANDTEHEAIAAYIEGVRKLGIYVTADSDAYSDISITDLGITLLGLAYKRSIACYTAKKAAPFNEYLDAAVVGNSIAATPGTRAYDWNRLTGITDSGDPNNLTKGKRNILQNKGYNWSEQYKDSISIFFPALTSYPVEIRIMQARDYFMFNVENDLFNLMLSNDLSAYDDPTFAQIEEILTYRLEEQVTNRTGTEYTINMPDPDTINSAERATHQLTLTEVFVLKLNSKVSEMYLTGIWEG
jgi:hypothetical protein